VLHHRRPISEAVEVFRLSVHPAWLDHVASDAFLSPDEFAHRYLDVFPDAEITHLYRARALHWRQDPSGPARPFPGRWSGARSGRAAPPGPPANGRAQQNGGTR
jgi:hypothetical protein